MTSPCARSTEEDPNLEAALLLPKYRCDVWLAYSDSVGRRIRRTSADHRSNQH